MLVKEYQFNGKKNREDYQLTFPKYAKISKSIKTQYGNSILVLKVIDKLLPIVCL